MSTLIKLRRSAVPGKQPNTSQLELGEVAINTYDGKIFIKKDVGGTETIVEFSADPNDILELIKTVDGAGSNLDADLLDGQQGDYYLDYVNFANTAALLQDILSIDGAGSLIDADLLDGQEGTYYLDYNNFTNVPPASLDLTLTGKVTGTAFTNTGIMTLATELANTGVTPGTYGSVSLVPILTIDEDGRVTVANTASVAGIDTTSWYSANNTYQIAGQDGSSFDTKIDDFDLLVEMQNLDVGSISSPTANNYFSGSIYVNNNINLGGLVDGRDVAVDGAKLDRLEEDLTVTLTGKVTGTVTSNTGIMTVVTELANTAVTPGTYGSPSQIPIFTVDEDGRLTAVSNTSVAGISDIVWNSANNTLITFTQDGGFYPALINQFGADVGFADSAKLTFGADGDLAIFHTGTTSIIEDTGTGNLVLKGSDLQIRSYFNNEPYLTATENGKVTLYHDNVARMDTTNTGIHVYDDIIVDGLVDGRDIAVDGAKLDGIEPGATADQTGAEILALLLPVDGDGSLLDADRVDGLDAQDIVDQAVLEANNNIGTATITLVAGDAIDGGGTFSVNQIANSSITFDHEDTSDVSNTSIVITNPGGTDTVISSIDFDDFGHVIDIQTANAQFGISEAEADLRYVNVTGDTMTGALVVNNTITTDGPIILPHGRLRTFETTTTTTNQTQLDSNIAFLYKSIEYIITAQEGSNVDVTKLLCITNGSVINATEFGRVTTGSELGTYEVAIATGFARLYVTPASSSNTVFTTFATYVDV
jgi:hypothetical protein